MGVQELVHRMIHGLGLHGLIDRHHNRIVVRRGKSHCLTKLVILIETGLTSKDDSTAARHHVANCPAANDCGADAEAAHLQEASTAENQGRRTFRVGIVLREHFFENL